MTVLGRGSWGEIKTSYRVVGEAGVDEYAAEAEAHLVVVKSLRTVIERYDQALAVLTQPNQLPPDSPA
jgi:hypothetical protein